MMHTAYNNNNNNNNNNNDDNNNNNLPFLPTFLRGDESIRILLHDGISPPGDLDPDSGSLSIGMT